MIGKTKEIIPSAGILSHPLPGARMTVGQGGVAVQVSLIPAIAFTGIQTEGIDQPAPQRSVESGVHRTRAKLVH
jgi:hypothetical protein